MASEESRLRIKKLTGVTHVEFIDRNILDEANIQLIGEEIGRLIEAEGKPKLLISFANVDHLSSAALGTLITINNKIKSRGGQLRLADIDQDNRIASPRIADARITYAGKGSVQRASREGWLSRFFNIVTPF